jgi:tetratricopeptide (TPR) repeat protein
MIILTGLFGSDAEEDDVDVLEEALARAKREPDSARAQFDVGTLQYARGQLNDARTALERAVELEPENGDAHYMLGLVYEDLERLDDARRAFESARRHTDNQMLRSYAEQKLKEMGKQPAPGGAEPPPGTGED